MARIAANGNGFPILHRHEHRAGVGAIVRTCGANDAAGGGTGIGIERHA
jgi:hypothetical protein